MADGEFAVDLEGSNPSDPGPAGPVVFTRIQEDLTGARVACFVTADGEAFSLGAEALALRIRLLRSAGEDSGEERRAQALL